MTSAYLDAGGNWQWFAKYNVGNFDIKSGKPASAPYFTFMYSGGGPGNCAEGNSDGFDTKDWTIYGMFTQPRPSPAKGCYALAQKKPRPANGMYTLIAKDGSLYQAYCDLSGGGWTRVYSNTFTSNHNGIKFNIDCPCGSGSGINNGAKAHNSQGWHLGVTGCHNSNKLSGKIGGKMTKYSFRMDFKIPNFGPASSIRHKGINHNDHGYDYKGSWAKGASRITSSVHKRDGEMTSAYLDAGGNWQWFAKYNVGNFDIKSGKPASAPYFTFMYSGGGPGNCAEGNSDGYDTKDWTIYGMFTQPRPSPVKGGCYALPRKNPDQRMGCTRCLPKMDRRTP